MAPLKDPRLLAAYRNALAEGCRFSGYVTWKSRPETWVFKELPSYTPNEIADLMRAHVVAGGEIDQVRETREEWLDFPYHYDLRLEIGGRVIYIETVILRDDPDDPQIEVVNIHDV